MVVCTRAWWRLWAGAVGEVSHDQNQKKKKKDQEKRTQGAGLLVVVGRALASTGNSKETPKNGSQANGSPPSNKLGSIVSNVAES